MTSRSRRSRAALAGLALLAVTAATALVQLPATAEEGVGRASGLADPDSFVTVGDTVAGLGEITAPLATDGTLLAVAPTAEQTSAAAALPSTVSVTWNDSGTPSSIISTTGVLAPATGGGAESTARSWIAAHRDLLGVSAAQVDGLELVSDQPLAGSKARAVLLRQRFGSMAPATRGMVTVGVADDGSVAYVSSSLVKADGAAPTATMTPLAGWLAAAADVGRSDLAGSTPRVISGPTTVAAALSGDWVKLSVPGAAQTQQARLRAFAYSTKDGRGVVRPVIEANVIDSSAGTSFAYRVMIDAVTGATLFRQNGVENSNNAFQFQGSYTAATCGQIHPFALTDANTRSIVVVGAAAVASDDITIKLYGPPANSSLLGTYDLLTSPETANYTPGTAIPQGTYGVQVCPFGPTSMTPTVGGPYAVNVVTSDTAAGASGGTGTGAAVGQPKWRAFAANPALSTIAPTTGADPDISVVECWFLRTEGCTDGEAHQNSNDAGPWDMIGGVPTFTTIGNNANTHEAWASFLTPGGLAQAPYSPTRDYTTKFTDVWNNSRCALSNFTPGGNDINAVTTNLFTGHNRIHDFAYSLGFTEQNYNLQLDNGGRGGQGGDQEIGNVQAGAATGGAAGQYMGRDNANQIALQDGVPGITNQYLFQPIAGAFYSPCTDGALDTGIYGHEYTHAISNRMVGGPDDGLTSDQGGAMGESWSDLNAAEYQFENDYLSDPRVATNPWSLGSYTTGNFAKGIRDYAINDNPLNYSDYGFDTTGAEVHADGEVWNGAQWEVRQALVNKWNAQFPYTDKVLQDRCASPTADPTRSQPNADSCPGNRRWLQLIFDAFLLQPGATDMLQARNAMLAADQMRFGGANRAELSAAFARRGMGAGASTSVQTDGSEDVVTPSFASAVGNNSAVTFSPVSGAAGRVFVGDYEARVTPVADTDPATPLGATATFTPGVYKMTFVSATRGFRRFVLTVPDSGVAFSQTIDDGAVNVASAAAGAKIIGSTAGSLNAASLIDGTEATNWSGTAYSTGTTATNIDDANVKPSVSVALANGLQTITSAKVSALLTPAPAAADPTGLGIPVSAEADPLSGSRFTALRKFALEACVASCDQAGATWKRFFESSDDAFPADVPRPVAPDQTMRSFAVPATQAAAVRLVALENQCTGQAKYAGEQDADATNATDCKTASTRGQVVHAAELQVFSQAVPSDPAPGTPGTGVPGSGTAGQGTSALPLPGQSSIGTSTTTRPGLAKTRTRIRLPRVQQVRGKESTKLTFGVVSTRTSGGAKAGTVVLKLDGKKVKRTKIVVTLKGGKKLTGKTFKISKNLSYGRHFFRATFTPTDKTAFGSSKSRRIVLTVVRTRPNAG